MGYTRKETDEKLQQILDFADIGDFIYQPVKVYSSGMFVRLAFAIAITVEPDILIIDEALSVGDVFFQQKCYKKIREFAGKATVLIVSHDLNAITKFCTRIIVMHYGKIVYNGDPNEAISHYFKLKQGQIKALSNAEGMDVRKNLKDFRNPDPQKSSGHMDAVIEQYYYMINDLPFAEYCEKNDEIHISMVVKIIRDIEDVIVGYQVRDKYGNEVFGETSLTSNVESFPLYTGYNLIAFSFSWPEIREGDYFLTLGIGEGTEVLNQVEQCWLNNVIHLVATTHGKTIFGIFNYPLDTFSIKRIDS